MNEQKNILQTSTGEFFQLARVYYEVFSKKTIEGAFKKLHCMDFDAQRNRWVWLFESEAKRLRFPKKHNQLSKSKRPVVIGAFTFRGESQMLLDVRSWERATKAIEFFDKRINRRAAKVTSLRVLNKLFEATHQQSQTLLQQSSDVFFDRDDIPPPKSNEIMEKLENIVVENPDIETRRQVAFEWIEQLAQEPIPEVEELPTNFYEDGILSLQTSLNLRQLELIERWQGNEQTSMLNIIQNLMHDSPKTL